MGTAQVGDMHCEPIGSEAVDSRSCDACWSGRCRQSLDAATRAARVTGAAWVAEQRGGRGVQRVAESCRPLEWWQGGVWRALAEDAALWVVLGVKVGVGELSRRPTSRRVAGTAGPSFASGSGSFDRDLLPDGLLD